MGEDDRELKRNWDQSHHYEGELQVCGFHTESLLIPNSKIPAIARDICGAASLFVSGWSVQTCPDICTPEKAVKMVLLLGQAGWLPSSSASLGTAVEKQEPDPTPPLQWEQGMEPDQVKN